MVAPHKDARERDSNKSRRRVIHGLLTPLDPSLTMPRTQYPAMVAIQGTENPLSRRDLQPCATHSNGRPHTRNEQVSGSSPLVGSPESA